MQINQKNIVSVLVPYWGNGNPYQDNLAKSLESHGVHIDKFASLKVVFKSIIFRGYRPDILHLHWLPLFKPKATSFLRLSLFILRLSIVRLLRIKIIWTVHNLKPHESMYPKIDWAAGLFVSRLANALVAHTENAKQQIISTWHLKRSGKKVFVIPHGNYIDCYENEIDRTTACKELRIPDSKIVFLFLGAIRPYKGVLQLIDTFKLMDNKITHLVIAGKPLNDELAAVIKEKVQDYDNITFNPGFVAEEKIQVYMNACDVVVFPYQDIFSSGAVILAMSFGKACLAPRIGCIIDTLDETGAFLFSPEDKDGLLYTIQNSIENKAKLQSMGVHNRKLAEELSWSNVAEKTMNVYKKCINYGSKTAPAHECIKAVK